MDEVKFTPWELGIFRDSVMDIIKDYEMTVKNHNHEDITDADLEIAKRDLPKLYICMHKIFTVYSLRYNPDEWRDKH